ncbi:hypothetical protein J2X36_002127 [Methylobacterium sp. BE186]|uniref:hypothetical protein n=1 Tax=Methylobacterium sp. BE186 TaxID=2817715 RepID=UPI002863E7B3|nr:hypothetical protein [Methylobacterium sp. BE186]MDR7037380.1 hypothetical protein [Methylobacterium sp. BE186]
MMPDEVLIFTHGDERVEIGEEGDWAYLAVVRGNDLAFYMEFDADDATAISEWLAIWASRQPSARAERESA